MFLTWPGAPTRDCLLTQAVPQYATFASLYDTFLGDHFFPQLRRAFEWLARRYGVHFASAADIGCGTGTFVRYLCERRVPVVYGVDRSPEMLRVAMAKNQNARPRFLLQDFAALQLPQLVDLMTCNFDSLNYLLRPKELLRALRRFNANLKPGGHVIFDMITTNPSLQSPGPHVERAAGPDLTLKRVSRWNPRHGIQTSIIVLSTNGRSHREIHIQRGYPIGVIAGLLAKARFRLLGVHDFSTLGPATRRTSRAVYVAQKPYGEMAQYHDFL